MNKRKREEQKHPIDQERKLRSDFSIDLSGKKLRSCRNSHQNDEKCHSYEAFFVWPFVRDRELTDS